MKRGSTDVLRVIDCGRIRIVAMSLGITQGTLDCSVKYFRGREQSGQMIPAFQAIQWKLVDMATRIEAARLRTYEAAWIKQQTLVSRWLLHGKALCRGNSGLDV